MKKMYYLWSSACPVYASSISICSIQRSLFTSIHIRQQYNNSTNLTEPFTVIACVLVQVLRKWSSTVWTSLPDPRQHKHWSGEVLPIPPQRRAECFHQFAASWSSTWDCMRLPRFILVCILDRYYIDIDIADQILAILRDNEHVISSQMSDDPGKFQSFMKSATATDWRSVLRALWPLCVRPATVVQTHDEMIIQIIHAYSCHILPKMSVGESCHCNR